MVPDRAHSEEDLRARRRYPRQVDAVRILVPAPGRKELQMRTRQAATDLLLKTANAINPFTSSSAAPLRSFALFDSLGPSLMPRAAVHQGMATGMSVLAADLACAAVDSAIRSFVPPAASMSVRFGARVAVGAAGAAVARLPETDEETTARASVRSAGRIVTDATIGGAIYEAALGLRTRFPARSPLGPVASGLAGFAASAWYARDLLTRRQGMIQRWTGDDTPATLAGSVGIGLGVAAAGHGIGRGFLASRRGWIGFFGQDRAHARIGRAFNAATWAAGGVGLYSAVVAAIASKNEVIEPAYATAPDNPHVSGGSTSRSPFEELGLQGRRYVTDVVTPEVIEATLGEPAKAHPIRAYVGVNSEPLYPSGRSEMMLDELERLGAFDRSYLLLISPTGTGWVDQAMIDAAEILTRGDIATACIQYGRGPSFLEVQKVQLGRSQFRGLLWGVKMRLQSTPPEKRPTILVFGESLGAWSSSDVVMHQGIEGFDHYGIDHALWFGLPGLAKWSKTGMRQGSTDLVPPGTVAAFDRFEQYQELTPEGRERLRAVVVDHDNDPIAQMSFRLAVKQPEWLTGIERGRGVAPTLRWIPLITFVQILVDATNAMRVVPGEFKSFGHDYRADTPDFVNAAYQLNAVTLEQMEAIHTTLRQRELERGERLKAAADATERHGQVRTSRRRSTRRDSAAAGGDAAIEAAQSGATEGDQQ